MLVFSYPVPLSWETSHALYCSCHSIPELSLCMYRDLVFLSVSDPSCQLVARHQFQHNTSTFKCICSPDSLSSISFTLDKHITILPTLRLEVSVVLDASDLSLFPSHATSLLTQSVLQEQPHVCALFPIPSATSVVQDREACGAVGNMDSSKTDSNSDSIGT